jgi:hypothetical protein
MCDAIQNGQLRMLYTWTPASRQLADRSDAVKRAADIASGTTPPALLFIHGERDQMLPPQITIDLYESLRPLYERAAAHSRLQLALVPDVAHAWTDTPAGASVAYACFGLARRLA